MSTRDFRAFAVHFKDLHLWNVNSFFKIGWQWPTEYIKPLETALTRKQIKVDRDKHHIDDLQLVTLHFDGTMEPRTVKDFLGTLYFAGPGDVIYSKIDVRNGAIGIIPEEMKTVAVSSEFPVYEVSKKVAIPEYIRLVFRTHYFREAINSMISGTSGRKRVQPSQILKVEIPLPPLHVQEAVVNEWKMARLEIETAYSRVESLKNQLDVQFLRELGLELPTEKEKPKCFAVDVRSFHRWSVRYNQNVLCGTDIKQSKYPVVELDSILLQTQYGTSEKANNKGEGTPILRINNIKDRRIVASDIKHITLPKTAFQGLKLKDGDILIIRTSGSRDLVGTCAVFHETSDYVFASYLIRLRVNPDVANPDFVSWFINSSFGREQIEVLSRQIMQNNINSEEIRSLQIPLPPIHIQTKIMQSIEAGVQSVTQEEQFAKQRDVDISQRIEKLIMGQTQVIALAQISEQLST